MTLDPYTDCPEYHGAHWHLRRVQPADAPDLLACYSDPITALHFNADNCTSDFRYQTLEEMERCISFWEIDYGWRSYVRFSVISQESGKAVGTVEIGARSQPVDGFGRIGMLRIDLASAYESAPVYSELLKLAESFYADFAVRHLLTKAIPADGVRIGALRAAGFSPLEDGRIVPFPHYYITHKPD